jgi:hypothetical protein
MELLFGHVVLSNPAGTFFISHRCKGNYDFEFPDYFLVSMCDHTGPHLLVFRLHFRTESTNDHADDSSPGWRIEPNRDQKFCL